MTEENQQPNEEQQEEQQEETQAPVDSEIVEVEWEEVERLVEIREALRIVDEQLSSILTSVEKQKFKLLTRAEQLESAMFEFGHKLRDSKGIDPSITYELKLPQTAGEKAYFIKK